jgi:hypothetical protein
MEISLKELTEKNIENMLNEAIEIFKKVDVISIRFQTEKNDGVDFYRELLKELTGYYMYLNPKVARLTSGKKNKRLTYYHTKKIEIEEKGDKFIDASTKKYADSMIKVERTALGYFEAYHDSCLEGMRTCRSKIKDYYENQEHSIDGNL